MEPGLGQSVLTLEGIDDPVGVVVPHSLIPPAIPCL